MKNKSSLKDIHSKIKKLKAFLSQLSLFEKIFLLLPILMWFSYWPNFHIGRKVGMNLEFSLPLVACFILSIVSMINILSDWRKSFDKIISTPSLKITFMFIAWNWISFFWSENPLRTFLTAGIWSVLWLIFVGVTFSKNLSKIILFSSKTLIIASGIISIIAVLQVAIGAFTDWGLCRGCVAGGFGFVRPSVFAIEPQFLGSLLLAPILILWWIFLKGKVRKVELIIMFLDLIAMYLTLSRGAIFSLMPSMLVVIFLSSRDKIIKKLASFFAIIGLSFSLGMVIHATFTELNPRISDSFYDSISKSINQMSLGKISLPKIQDSNNIPQKTTNNELINQPVKASFDGYVEKSTDERTKLSNLALKTWSRDISTILFGVGSGGSGVAILKTTQQTSSSSEIVQNEYISILLELGIVGILIFTIIIIGFFKKTLANKISWGIILAFLLQWFFFSGLPNALHVYLILMMVFLFRNSKD